MLDILNMPVASLNWLQNLRLNLHLGSVSWIFFVMLVLFVYGMLCYFAWTLIEPRLKKKYGEEHSDEIITKTGKVGDRFRIGAIVLGLVALAFAMFAGDVKFDDVYRVTKPQKITKVQQASGADNMLLTLKSGKTVSVPETYVKVKLIKQSDKAKANYYRIVPKAGITAQQARSFDKIEPLLTTGIFGKDHGRATIYVTPSQSHAKTWNFE